jgi:hypothetical protein
MITTQKELDRRVREKVKAVWDNDKTLWENGTALMKASGAESDMVHAKNLAGEISFEAFSDEIQVLVEVSHIAAALRRQAGAQEGRE